MAAISTAGQRSIVFRERRLPTNLRNNRQVGALPSTPMASGGSLSPLFLSILLIGSQSLVIVVCNILLALNGEGDRGTPDYTEAAIAGLGVAVLFCIVRPMIHLSTADPRGADFFSTSVTGTLAALALAELAALGGYAYVSHYLGTTVPPVSFHHWLRAWAMATAAVGLQDIAAGWYCRPVAQAETIGQADRGLWRRRAWRPFHHRRGGTLAEPVVRPRLFRRPQLKYCAEPIAGVPG